MLIFNIKSFSEKDLNIIIPIGDVNTTKKKIFIKILNLKKWQNKSIKIILFQWHFNYFKLNDENF